MIVIGNKSDAAESRQVEKEEAEQYCKSKGLKYVEASAKSG
jgi:hypothetical protein